MIFRLIFFFMFIFKVIFYSELWQKKGGGFWLIGSLQQNLPELQIS